MPYRVRFKHQIEGSMTVRVELDKLLDACRGGFCAPASASKIGCQVLQHDLRTMHARLGTPQDLAPDHSMRKTSTSTSPD